MTDKAETDSELLTRLGMDGALWTAEMVKRGIIPSEQEDAALGWLCNAIMAGYDRSPDKPATHAAMRQARDALEATTHEIEAAVRVAMDRTTADEMSAVAAKGRAAIAAIDKALGEG